MDYTVSGEGASKSINRSVIFHFIMIVLASSHTKLLVSVTMKYNSSVAVAREFLKKMAQPRSQIDDLGTTMLSEAEAQRRLLRELSSASILADNAAAISRNNGRAATALPFTSTTSFMPSSSSVVAPNVSSVSVGASGKLRFTLGGGGGTGAGMASSTTATSSVNDAQRRPSVDLTSMDATSDVDDDDDDDLDLDLDDE
jgi:hypothetical protein